MMFVFETYILIEEINHTNIMIDLSISFDFHFCLLVFIFVFLIFTFLLCAAVVFWLFNIFGVFDLSVFFLGS